MPPKLFRITTVPLSLEKLLEGQLTFMSQYYEVTAVSADKKRLQEFGKSNGVATFHVEMTRAITPIKDLKALFKLYRFLRRKKPLIVHTHTPKAGILGMLAAKLSGVPLRLHTVAGLPLLETTGRKRKVLNIVEKLTYAFATKVYPNSKGLYDIILQENYASPDKLKILGKGSSNGIDTIYFDPDLFSNSQREKLKTGLGIPTNDVVFIFIGRLVTDKGINDLVSAFQKLNLENKNTTLLLVGPFEEDLDPLKPEIFEGIHKHPKIISTGYQIDVRSFLAISDVLSFPSYREGFPNVVMQAGAMSLPAIVTNINGCNEIISDQENGLIIPVKNEKALLEAMHFFISKPEEKKRMALNARGKICKHYDRKEFWNILLSEYQQLEKEQKDK